MTEQTAVTLDGWVEAATHYPLLPSGVRVGIRIPDLAALVEAGEIPQHLMDVALAFAGGGNPPKPSKELIAKQKEFTDKLVQITVVEPELPDDLLPKIPYEDKEFLVAIATRTRDLDAEGEHLAGLTTSEKFRRFRGLGEFVPDVEGA
jgi:hypothetical protein